MNHILGRRNAGAAAGFFATKLPLVPINFEAGALPPPAGPATPNPIGNPSRAPTAAYSRPS